MNQAQNDRAHQQNGSHTPEALRTIKCWKADDKQWIWIYGGPCQVSGCGGEYWIFNEDCVMTGAAYCTDCTDILFTEFTIDSIDWIVWALNVVGGRYGYHILEQVEPPPTMGHHNVNQDWLE